MCGKSNFKGKAYRWTASLSRKGFKAKAKARTSQAVLPNFTLLTSTCLLPSLEFCFFEVGKKIGVELAGSKEAAQKNRTAIYILGASGAEVIATTLLTPLEAARIRLVSDRTYAKGLASALTRVFKDGQAYAG